MSHIKWPDISSFHAVRRDVQKWPELLGGNATVTYRPKVKLHGTNAAIQLRKGGKIFCQSRERLITPGDDNVGFARWVESNADVWRELRESVGYDIVIFGEWCGPGIMKGTAINKIDEKFFAIFAMATIERLEATGEIEFDPYEIVQELEPMLDKLQNVDVLPWLPWDSTGMSINLMRTADELKTYIDDINDLVAEVEGCDPWVKERFGIEGIGEGLVFYPISHPGHKRFSDLAFKAKGEKHKVVKTKKSVQADPEVVKSIEAFVDLVITDARLEQGARAVNRGELEFDKKLTGAFIGWIGKDIKKECGPELEAAGLEWKQVAKVVSKRAAVWYTDRS